MQPHKASASSGTAPRHASLPDFVTLGALRAEVPLAARARLLGVRIDSRAVLEDAEVLAAAGNAGLTYVFRYGAVVTFDPDERAIARLEAALLPHVIDPEKGLDVEVAAIEVREGDGDRIGPSGQIRLVDASADRLQLVAIVLARNVVLSRDEVLVSDVFDRVAPLVAELREKGRASPSIRRVMRLVGEVLAARHRVMGTVQVEERPEVLWDNPGLDRLYARLEAEFELDDRAEVLERKFVALGDFAEALLDIVQGKRAFRLELGIIALIAFEIVLSLVSMLGHGR